MLATGLLGGGEWEDSVPRLLYCCVGVERMGSEKLVAVTGHIEKRMPRRDIFEGEAAFMWWVLFGPFLLGLLATLIAPKIIGHSEQARAAATAHAAMTQRPTPTPTPTPTPNRNPPPEQTA